MQDELHIFIIWNKGLYLKEPIIDDLKKRLEIKQIFNFSWETQSFAARLSQLYGKNLARCCKKEKECGTGDFLVIVANDANPQYNNAMNTNILSLKYKYRSWYGGGFLIHASDNTQEAEENLKFLTGMSFREFLNRYPDKWDGKVETYTAQAALPMPRRQSLYLKLLHGLHVLF